MENKTIPYVSVIMTSYNRGHYIGQAIDSILAQECKFPFEIIIGDDCSTDNSRELLQSYKDKYPDIFVLNFHEANVGFGPNWASTLKLARGKYVTFCDDDDYYCDTHRMQSMVDYMDAHPEYGLTHTNYYNLFMETGEKVPNNAKDSTGTDAVWGLRTGGYNICFGACMIRYELIQKHVDLDAYIRLKFPIQDWPTCMLLALHTVFKYLNQLSYVYRKHKGSMSSPQEYDTIVRKYTQEKVMNRYVHEQLGIEYDEPGDDRYRYSILLRLAYDRNDYRKAHEFAKHCDKRNKKRWFAMTWLSFQLFRIAKKIKSKLLKK